MSGKDIIDRCHAEGPLLFIDGTHDGEGFHAGEVALYREAVRLRDENARLGREREALLSTCKAKCICAPWKKECSDGLACEDCWAEYLASLPGEEVQP